MIDSTDGTSSACDNNSTATSTNNQPHPTPEEEQLELEYIREHRAYIKEQSRLAFYTKLLIPEVNLMHPVPFKRKLSTHNCPSHNFKIHRKEGF